MRYSRSFLAVLTALACADFASGQSTVTFENATLVQPLTGPGTFQNGSTLSPPGSFTTAGATFNNNYNASFDFWSGWGYSNVTDISTPGFMNQYAAYNLPGGGSGDSSPNYGVAFGSSPGDATIAVPAGLRPDSMRITNTTYAALSMLNGDAFAKQFGGASGNDPDFFRLTITGTNASNQVTGTVDFYLADYRFADNSQDYVVSQWTTVDLSGLGSDTSVLSFGLTSTDVGEWGMNTPAYFAADTIRFIPVPEPYLAGLAAGLAFAAWSRKRRQSRSPVSTPGDVATRTA